MTTNRKYLTVNEMAEALGVTPQTLYLWRKKSTGPKYIRLGTTPRAHIRYFPLETDSV